MSRIEKTRERILLGSSDAKIDFDDLRRVLTAVGFTERIKGSHHIFVRRKVDEIINIQPKQNRAKAYPGQAGS